MSGVFRTALLAAAGTLTVCTTFGAEIKVMTAGAFRAALVALVPTFESATQHKVVIVATATGGAQSVPSRLQRGEAVDVVIVADALLDQFILEGKLAAGSRVALARSAIGMVVRKGASKPDIGSVEALKRALLQAKSIAYSNNISGIYLSTELFPRLGIYSSIAGRCRKIEGEPIAAVVARGDAEIGFQQISELLPVPGVDFVGPLPPEVQKVSVFSAGIGAAANTPEAAKAFIRFLASPDAAFAISKSGLEPITP